MSTRERGPRNRFGTAGTKMLVVDNQYPAVRIIAGPAGCWFFFDHEHEHSAAPSQNTTGWTTYASAAAAEAAAPLQALSSGVALPTVWPFDSTKPLSSVVRCGGTLVDVAAGLVLPTYGQAEITVRANGFLHIGGAQTQPMQWIAPNNVFHFQSAALSTAAQRNTWYVNVFLEEPVAGRA